MITTHANYDGETALDWACIINMESIALELLKKPNIDYNHVGSDGNTALGLACDNKMESIIMKLLDNQIGLIGTIGIGKDQWLDQMIVKYNDMQMDKQIAIDI